MTKASFSKRRYTDIRYAIGILAPIFAYTNFILLAYNFTELKNILPFYLFAPMFSIGMIILLVYVGLLFRKKQQATDITLAYERSVEGNRTARISMEHIMELGEKLGVKPTQEYIDRVAYLRKIEREEV